MLRDILTDILVARLMLQINGKASRDRGAELPSATYYYVIHFNNGKLFKQVGFI
jgi:hypothetical protein